MNIKRRFAYAVPQAPPPPRLVRVRPMAAGRGVVEGGDKKGEREEEEEETRGKTGRDGGRGGGGGRDR